MPRTNRFSWILFPAGVVLLLCTASCAVPVLNRPAWQETAGFSVDDPRYAGGLALGMTRPEVDLLYRRPTDRGKDFRSSLVLTTDQGEIWSYRATGDRKYEIWIKFDPEGRVVGWGDPDVLGRSARWRPHKQAEETYFQLPGGRP